MVITYRRTDGLFRLFTLAVAALAATVLTVAVAGFLLIVAAAIAAVALIGRAVVPGRWRQSTVPPITPWPHETIDATVVSSTSPSDTPNLRLDDNTK
jgi:hypothetical protein